MSKLPTDNQLESLAKVLECADERLSNGWNAKDDTTRNMEMSIGLKMLSTVRLELCCMASRITEENDAARKAAKEGKKQ